MTYIIKYIEGNYRKDYRSYLFFSHRKQWILIIGLLIVSSLIYIISFFPLFNFNIKWIAFSVFILGFVQFTFELINTYFAIKYINETANKFKSCLENLFIESTSIKLSYGKIHYITVFYSQIKKCLILKNVMFIIYKSKKDWPLRINKSEISEAGFSKLTEIFKSKNILIQIR